ncbi:hypothetical protein RN001_003666 [Aquatica leii]|uniref:THAP-type domain-containing protein n=1 Tax=Aquatica leii TaxID=1421715 RepID=A0AAN7PFF1_9COLE|nr:hypothetical protein RN001_003666 [Aquatica leii]
MCRRADRDPTREDRLCSCHFTDGNKFLDPSIFPRNEEGSWKFPTPEKRRKTKVAVSTTPHIKDFNIAESDTIDTVYIPPTVGELTDEEDIDDNLLEEDFRPSDIAGTFEVHLHQNEDYSTNQEEHEQPLSKKRKSATPKLQKPTPIWQKEEIELSTSQSKESVRKEKLVNLLEGKSPIELFSLLIDDELMLQIVNYSVFSFFLL